MKAIPLHKRIENWNQAVAQKWGLHLLRYSLAIVFIWFGALKPLGLSPATELVTQTVFWFSPKWFVPFLGFWEVAIGLLLLSRLTLKYGVWLIYLHLPCTFLPLFIVPETSYVGQLAELTLVGQYIIKNLVFVAAAIIIGGDVKAGSSKAKVSVKSKKTFTKKAVRQKESAW